MHEVADWIYVSNIMSIEGKKMHKLAEKIPVCWTGMVIIYLGGIGVRRSIYAVEVVNLDVHGFLVFGL